MQKQLRATTRKRAKEMGCLSPVFVVCWQEGWGFADRQVHGFATYLRYVPKTQKNVRGNIPFHSPYSK